MVVLACMQHWYESAIFFGPIFALGVWVWYSGRRHAAAERDRGSSGSGTQSRAVS